MIYKDIIHSIKPRDDDISCREHYKLNEELFISSGLPTLNKMNDLLDKWKKTWLDLYSIEYDSYPSFNDFKGDCGSLNDKNKYIELS